MKLTVMLFEVVPIHPIVLALINEFLINRATHTPKSSRTNGSRLRQKGVNTFILPSVTATSWKALCLLTTNVFLGAA